MGKQLRLFLMLLGIIVLLFASKQSNSEAQFGGVVPEVGEFTICSQGLQRHEVIKRCVLKQNPAGPQLTPIEEEVGEWNPFLPNPYYNSPFCYNKSSHLNPGDDPDKDDPSKPVEIEKVEGRHISETENAPNTGVKGTINTDGKEKPEGDEPYLVIFLKQRSAITSFKMKVNAIPQVQGKTAEYVMYTGFKDNLNPRIARCTIGTVHDIPLDGREYNFKIADRSQLPLKADFIVIKRLLNATPSTLRVENVSFKGVSPHDGVPGNITSLKGKVYMSGKTNLNLNNVTIYDETDGEDKKKLIASSNTNGNYFSTDLTGFSGRRKIVIERNGFVPRRETVTLNQGKDLEKNFPLTLAKPNLVSGKVADRTGKGLPNIALIATKDGEIAHVGVTDKNGSYRLELPDKGSYTIQPAVNQSIDAPKFLANKAEILFDSVNGKSVQRNFQASPEVKNGTYKLLLSIHEDIGTSRSFPVDLIGPSLTFYNGTSASGQPIVEIKSFNRSLIDLPYGTVTFTVRAKGYHPTTQTITNTEKDEKRLSVNLKSIANPCSKTPFTHMKEFWFCGNEAKAAINTTETKQKLEAIDAKIGSLRQTYGYAIPHRVVVVSGFGGASFTWGTNKVQSRGPYGLSIVCPPPITNEEDFAEGETITFNLQRIERTSLKDLEHVTTHEWGHNKDYREGNCDPMKFRSNLDDYITMRQLGELLSTEQFGTREVFYDALIDNGYDKSSDAGHPYSNTRETYASAFHAIHEHAPELKQYTTIDETGKTNRFSPQLANVISYLTQATLIKSK